MKSIPWRFAVLPITLLSPLGVCAADLSGNNLILTGDADVVGRAEVGTFRINTNNDQSPHQRHGWRRFSWGGDGTSNWNEWKKVARLYAGGTSNSAIAFEGRIYDHRSNYASQRGISIPFSGAVRGFIGTGDSDNNTVRLAQGQAEGGNQYIRIVRLEENDFELQVRQAVAWRWMEVEWRITGDAAGNQTIDYFDTGALTAGSTGLAEFNPTYDHFDSTGTLLAGKVGVGTTSLSQSHALDVAGDIRLSGSIVKNGGGTIVLPTSGTLTLPAAGGTLVTTSGTQTITGTTNVVGTTTLGGATADKQLKIDSGTGNVGIGTASPATKLDIVGGNGILHSHVDTDATLKTTRVGVRHYTNAEEPFYWALANSGSSINELYLGGGTTLGNAATALRFITAENNTTTAGTERMRIDGFGNVGIGTASPTSKLHVVGDITSSGTITGSYLTRSALFDNLFLTGQAAGYGNVFFGFHTNQIANYLARGGAISAVYTGGVSDGGGLLDYLVSHNSYNREHVLNVASPGSVTYTLTGVSLDTLSFGWWRPFLASRLSLSGLSQVLVEYRQADNTTWSVAVNDTAPKLQNSAAWASPVLTTLPAPYTITGVRFTLAFGGTPSTIRISELGLYHPNQNFGRYTLAGLNASNTFYKDQKIAGKLEVAGDITIKNVGGTKSVIRISAAGDIPMIANPVGTNPNPNP